MRPAIYQASTEARAAERPSVNHPARFHFTAAFDFQAACDKDMRLTPREQPMKRIKLTPTLRQVLLLAVPGISLIMITLAVGPKLWP